jgi:hypothetical protein
MVLCTLLESC